eukprot:11334063-Karenia_brevis.AAC.1
MTAWKRVFGRKALPRKYVGWGEKVLRLPGGKRKAQAAEKWFEGICLGLKDKSEEGIIGTPEGCFHARSIRRLSKNEASDAVLLNAIA